MLDTLHCLCLVIRSCLSTARCQLLQLRLIRPTQQVFVAAVQRSHNEHLRASSIALRYPLWSPYILSVHKAYTILLLGRPTYVSADLLGFTGILYSSFFRHLPSELAEWNSTKTGHMLESKCDLKMHVQNLKYTLPLQIGGPKTTFFRRLRNWTATLTAYIFGTKHIWTIGKCVDNYKGPGGLDSQVGSVVRQTAKVPGSIPGRRKSVGHRWHL